MRSLLFVCHAPSENTARLRDVAATAVTGLGLDNLALIVKSSPETEADDVRACDGILIGTTENFGYMAGLTKDFFERIYYPCLESKQGLPAALYIKAGEDGRGTRAAVGKIVTGLRWKYVSEPLILRGQYREEFEGQVSELAMTLAAGLDAGIY